MAIENTTRESVSTIPPSIKRFAVDVRGYSFAYPAVIDSSERHDAATDNRCVLDNMTLSVEEGAFCVLTGPTGCGKTTLLRSLKPELAPVGQRAGFIDVLGAALVRDGEAVDSLPARESAALIGYVMQDPDAQIVCDTVWHEIAFGLENIGMPQDAMRRRIAEVAHFFGIEPWMRSQTETLSGGQKQLVNLAGVLALRPRLLLLDEPTAQLDPNARRLFLMMLERVNRELGVTVIMATHAPEDVERMATQHVEMGPIGELGNRAQVERNLIPWWRERRVLLGMPALSEFAIQSHTQDQALNTSPVSAAGLGSVSAKAPSSFSAPARVSIETTTPTPTPISTLASDSTPTPSSLSFALEARESFFRYERKTSWVLRGVDVRVRQGSVHAFVGGNGCGKSTLLKVLAGVLKPQRGRVVNVLHSSQAMLPQDPKALFVCDSVAEELDEWRERCGYTMADEAVMMERFGLTPHAAQHPYDLSGGQQQKLAFAKLLLTGARLLFLDEPTKGLDAQACADAVRIVRELADEGRTVVLVTHDLDFAYACADEVSMLFDGEVACTQPTGEFFAENLVYRPNEESRLFGALL